MRSAVSRILVDHARRRHRAKRAGQASRCLWTRVWWWRLRNQTAIC
ncbi:MAG: hypothetical protein H0T77_11905 [Pyrinomonadaceae bacterium]|nr:hypothetical protein [Pyrinomonadaceae bacterium]